MPGPASLYPGSTPSFPWRNGPGILSGAPGKGCWVGCSCRTFREEKNKQSNQNRQGVRPLAGGRRLHLSQYACLLKRVGEGAEQHNRKNRNNRASKRKREEEKKLKKKREKRITRRKKEKRTTAKNKKRKISNILPDTLHNSPVEDGLQLQSQLHQLVKELGRVGQQVEKAHHGGSNIWFLARFPSLCFLATNARTQYKKKQ